MQMPLQLESTKMSPMCRRVEGLSRGRYGDVYGADVRVSVFDIWAFMRMVKANVITVEGLF